MMTTNNADWIANAVRASGHKPGEGSAGFDSGHVPDLPETGVALPRGSTLATLYAQGDAFCRTNAIAHAAMQYAPDHYGYYVGLGAMQYHMTKPVFLSLRNSLPQGATRTAFDTAVTLWIGMVLTPVGE